MSKREEQRKRREYSLRLRKHRAQRATLPECRLLQLKIDCLCAHHYAPDSEEARAYLEKAKKYTLKQRLHFINLYMKQYDELLYEGFSTGEGEKIKNKK